MSNLFLSTDETSFEAGIKVQIHTQDEPPFIDQLGFGVAPGFQTFVSCQEQRVCLGNEDRKENTENTISKAYSLYELNSALHNHNINHTKCNN